MLVSLHPKSIPRIYKHEKSDYLFQDNRFFLSDPPGGGTLYFFIANNQLLILLFII